MAAVRVRGEVAGLGVEDKWYMHLLGNKRKGQK